MQDKQKDQSIDYYNKIKYHFGPENYEQMLIEKDKMIKSSLMLGNLRNDRFSCTVCHKIVNDPLQCQKCQKTLYCRHCVTKSWSDLDAPPKFNCYECTGQIGPCNPLLIKILNSNKVICKYGYQVDIQHKISYKTLTTTYFDEHHKQKLLCPLGLVCNKELTTLEQAEMHLSECPHALELCRKCHMIVPRNHTALQCKKSLLEKIRATNSQKQDEITNIQTINFDMLEELEQKKKNLEESQGTIQVLKEMVTAMEDIEWEVQKKCFKNGLHGHMEKQAKEESFEDENLVNCDDVMNTSDNSKLLIDTSTPQIEETPDQNQIMDNNDHHDGAEWEVECNPDAQFEDFMAIETS